MNSNHMPTFRVIEVLRVISESKEGLTLTDISKELNITKSTLQPILKELTNNYILNMNKNKIYTIGANLFKYGQSYLNKIDVMSLIREEMKNIVYDCNEICQLGVEDSANPGNVLYLHKEEPYQSVKLMSYIGMSLPANVSALGKCLLIKYSDNDLRYMFKNGLVKLTNNTITDINELIGQVNDVKNGNLAHERGEASEDIECYAIPIYMDKEVIASVSISTPIYRMDNEKRNTIKNTLEKYKEIFANKIY